MVDSDKIVAEQKSALIVRVSAEQTSVCCRGASGSLGHPAVYLDISQQQEVTCYYCGRVFRKSLWVECLPH